MKKIILLLFLVFLLTGCSAEVNLIINDTGINETITFKDSNTSAYKNYIPVFYTDIYSDIEPDVKNEGIKYYNKNIIQDVNGYKIDYSYKYTLDEYKKARSVKGAFKSFNIRKNDADGQIIFSTDTSGLRYFDTYLNLESVKLNIIPSYKVLESNADYVNNGVYTWIFNKNTKKHVYLMLDNPSKNSNSNNNNNKPSDNGNSSSNDSNSFSTNENDKKNDDKKDSNKQEVNSKKEDKPFLEKYPYIILVGCIVIFLMFVIILVKVMKTE